MTPEQKQQFIQDTAERNAISSQGEFILWSRHAIQELVADNLKRLDIERSLRTCELIEDYPTHHRPLPDCLVLGWITNNEPIHGVVAIDEELTRILIVTVYRPGKEEWNHDWKTRK